MDMNEVLELLNRRVREEIWREFDERFLRLLVETGQ
jgi:hypothetical protein